MIQQGVVARVSVWRQLDLPVTSIRIAAPYAAAAALAVADFDRFAAVAR
jgi:hypothetical protein